MKFDAFLAFHWLDKDVPLEQIYDNMLEIAIMSDEMGFDIAWIAEHHLIDFIACPSPFAFAGLVAGQTKRIRLGIGVAILPFYHPLRLIGDAAVTDLLSHGRLELGIGRGAFPHATTRFGYADMEDGRGAFQEATDVLLKMWQSNEAIEHHGKYWSFDKARVVPEPLQKPHPPIWVAGQTFPTIEWAVQKRLNVLNTPWRDSIRRVQEVCAYHQAARARYGVSREESRIAMSRMCFVGETEADVRRQLKWTHHYQDLIVTQHNGTAAIQNGHVIRQAAADATTGERLVDPKRFGWDGASKIYNDDEVMENLLFGTPDQVRAKLKAYEEAGLDHLKVYTAFGQPHEDVMRSLRLFATEVMPYFKEKEPAAAAATA